MNKEYANKSNSQNINLPASNRREYPKDKNKFNYKRFILVSFLIIDLIIFLLTIISLATDIAYQSTILYFLAISNIVSILTLILALALSMNDIKLNKRSVFNNIMYFVISHILTNLLFVLFFVLRGGNGELLPVLAFVATTSIVSFVPSLFLYSYIQFRISKDLKKYALNDRKKN